jgi:hypothetical protein
LEENKVAKAKQDVEHAKEVASRIKSAEEIAREEQLEKLNQKLSTAEKLKEEQVSWQFVYGLNGGLSETDKSIGIQAPQASLATH